MKVPRPGEAFGENRPRTATGSELAAFLGKKGQGLVTYTPKHTGPATPTPAATLDEAISAAVDELEASLADG